jgi:uncharacterized protein (DUF433 family)
MDTTTTEALIVETPRGPSLAGTRLTVYSVLDLIKAGWSKHLIAHTMELTAEQVEAIFAYVEAHQDEVEAAYARILEREALARAESERIMRERSSFPPDMPWEEKRKLIIQRLEERKRAAQEQNGNHDSH